MGIGKAESILAPALFILNLPVAQARLPDKITYGSGGRVEDLLALSFVDATMAE